MPTPEELAAVLLEDFRKFIGAGGSSSYDDEFLQNCIDEGSALVDVFVGEATVPAPVLRRAKVNVASELFHAQSAPTGISQFANGDGNPVRVARNPMVAAYRILTPYVGLGIG